MVTPEPLVNRCIGKPAEVVHLPTAGKLTDIGVIAPFYSTICSKKNRNTIDHFLAGSHGNKLTRGKTKGIFYAIRYK